jgi:murein DD-endopeptidase MepM/ murein hydrolase activator NlpD
VSVLLVVAAPVAPLIVISVAHAQSISDLTARLDQARRDLADARANAQSAAAAFASSQSAVAEVENKIGDTEILIANDRARAETLQTGVRKRAVFAYTHAGSGLDMVISASDPVQAARRTELLNHANQTDAIAVRRLAALNQDLKDRETELKVEQEKQQTISAQNKARSDQMSGALDVVQRKANDLNAQLAAAEKKASDEEARRRLTDEQARLSQSATLAGTVLKYPTISGFMCPVFGAAYTDDFGGPRNHMGNDLFVPIGRPAVAVKGGSVRYVPNEGAGGNTAYLSADDGNVYFYAHLSQFVGGARSVAQGEVIASTGMTGNATAPHLHFEIRIGGANGSRVDPYPTLKATGC